MIYRINLSKIKVRRILSTDVLDKDTTKPETPGTVITAVQNEVEGINESIAEVTDSKVDAADSTEESKSAPSDLDFKLGMEPSILSPWNNNPEDYPHGNADFAVDEADRPRVMMWLTGQVSGTVKPPSDKLVKDMTSVTKSLLTNYFDKAAEADLFTAPCRMGWAYRFKNGTRKMMRPMELTVPNDRSPLLPIALYNFHDGGVHTDTEITNHPCCLTITPSRDPIELSGNNIASIDIVAGPQPDMIPSDFKILNISTEIVDGTNRKVFFYTRSDASALTAEAAIMNDLRIIASLTPDTFKGTEKIKVPLTPGALANWKLLPKYSSGSSGEEGDDDSGNTYDPDIWEPIVNLETEPLDLGKPDVRKSLRAVHLCGIYDRESISITLYGSRHREKWIKIASGKRGWISGLAAARFPWWKIRIKGALRPNDSLEALTFDYR